MFTAGGITPERGFRNVSSKIKTLNPRVPKGRVHGTVSIFQNISEALPRRWMSVTDRGERGRLRFDLDHRPPDSFAIRGMSQAGETCAEVPIARRTSQVQASSSACSCADHGIGSRTGPRRA